jgi:hypothetical protein
VGSEYFEVVRGHGIKFIGSVKPGEAR